MIYLLYGIFFVSCIVLIISVLLQPGKTDAGALFTSNISSNAFGSRGTATVLSKLTITAAVCFMLSALFISLPALSGTSSVLANNPDTPAESVTQPPITNLNGNANIDANAPANTAIDANAANSAPSTAVNAANVKVTNSSVKTANTKK